MVDDLRVTADTFGRLRDRASTATRGIGRRPRRAGPVVDRDECGVGVADAAGATLGLIAGKLTDTGDAHLAGHHAATPNASGAPPELPRLGTSAGVGARAGQRPTSSVAISCAAVSNPVRSRTTRTREQYSA